ncbi:hypothetical protein GMA5_18 [Gordonia phage GMA5]|uniref:Helix-turn-helix DNA binding domain protein n=1 Tax=Gordonia phage GMA5 TaxID=1647472 RepID=A0A0K0MWN0_9CAUD|nr:HTH DNA binding protein [Gordonia phage GMA5]AKI28632.1 hypothetical protein GMA5_18 [Gordonia phage GMA5]
MSARDNAEFAAFSRRIMRAYARRVATADPAALGELMTLRAEVDTAIAAAVDGLRAEGFSWADIGAEVGLTRQAAQQRWGVNKSLTPKRVAG